MSMDETASPAADGQGAFAPTANPGALLQTIGSGATDPTSLVLSQLGGLAQDNPGIAMLLGLLGRRRSGAEAEAQPNEDGEEAELAAQRAESMRKEAALRVRELKETAKDLYKELKILRARNDALAAAVGACYVCFGSDPFCEECGGRGWPGSRLPESSAYREYVLPAVLRVQKLQSAHVRRTAQQGDSSDGATAPARERVVVRPEAVRQWPFLDREQDKPQPRMEEMRHE
jgi:hypothetical protein